MHQLNPTYNRAMEFAKNMNQHRDGISNIYVLHVKDRDGNLVDEKFCMNMLTDNGMSGYILPTTMEFPNKLFIGKGDGSFNHTTHNLISALTEESATIVDTTIDYKFPMYFDSVSQLVTCTAQFLKCKLPFTMTGLTTDVTITEYGLGNSINDLYTHSWVYDIEGNRTWITKKPDHEVEITVYLCMSYYTSLITNNYANGKYTVITTLERFLNKDLRMKPYKTYLFKRNNVISELTTSTTKSGFVNNEITLYTNVNEITLANGYNSDQGYMDGYLEKTNGFTTIERETNPNVESFDVIIKAKASSTYAQTSTCLSDRFGDNAADHIPITQANITKVSTFNPVTNAWDVDSNYVSDSVHWYTETPLSTNAATVLYYTNNNTVMTMYVYQNISINNPINSFALNQETVYATDAYWDVSQWNLITNLSEIPLTDRTRRYYITTTDQVSLIPRRASQGLEVNPSDGVGEENFGFPLTTNAPKCLDVCSNPSYHWYKHGNLFYSTSPINGPFTFGSEDNTTFAYGKWMIMCDNVSDSSIKYADMSDLSGGMTVTGTKLLPFGTTSLNMYSTSYKTETETGYVCLQSTNSSYKESMIIDLTGSTINVTKYNSTLACCIWGTKRFAYIDTSDTTKVKIYDFDNGSIVQEVTLPSNMTSPSIMFGHTTKLWLSNSSATIVIDITSGSIKTCSLTVSNIVSSLAYIDSTACNYGMIVYRRDQYDLKYAYYFLPSLEEDPHCLNDLTNYGSSDYYKLYIHLTSVNDNTYAMIISVGYYTSGGNYGSTNCVYDFGRYTKGSTAHIYVKNSTKPNFIPYGEYTITERNHKVPIEWWLPHRIVGTSNTISAINNLKHIKDKQYSITFTNIPVFNGKPPGVKQ